MGKMLKEIIGKTRKALRPFVLSLLKENGGHCRPSTGSGRTVFFATVFLSMTLALEVICPLKAFARADEENPVEEEAETAKVLSYGGEADFNSRYIWRGIKWSDGPVMQPSAWVDAYGFRFSVWGNFVINDEPNQGEFNEVDLILAYYKEWGRFTIEPDFQYWFYPNQDESPSTGELSLKAAYNVIGPFSVFTRHSFDLAEFRGSYFGEFGLLFSAEFLDEKASFENTASFGWGTSKFNEAYIGPAKNAINVVNFGASVIYYPVKFFYLRPHMEVSVIVDDELSHALEKRTLINGGLALGVEL